MNILQMKNVVVVVERLVQGCTPFTRDSSPSSQHIIPKLFQWSKHGNFEWLGHMRRVWYEWKNERNTFVPVHHYHPGRLSGTLSCLSPRSVKLHPKLSSIITFLLGNVGQQYFLEPLCTGCCIEPTTLCITIHGTCNTTKKENKIRTLNVLNEKSAIFGCNLQKYYNIKHQTIIKKF